MNGALTRKALALLFARNRRDVQRECETLQFSDIESLEAKLAGLGNETAEQIAEVYHVRMLLSCAKRLEPGLCDDVELFCGASEASLIAEDAFLAAQSAAPESPEQVTISQKMAAIRLSAGVEDVADWGGDVPDSYRNLEAERWSLDCRVYDSVLPRLLDAYGMSDRAREFRDDRLRFDVMFAVGRRLKSWHRSVVFLDEGAVIQTLRADHGDAAIDLLERRLAMHGLE